MYQLIIKPRVILMAKEAYDWYENQKTGLGEIFLSELDNSFKKIEITPTANSKIKKNYRQARLRKFPFVIMYEITKTDIVLLSIFHTSRNPKLKF